MSKFLTFVGLMVLAVLAGCTPTEPPSQENAISDVESISSVPLRLWIVSPVSDVSRVERQWRTGSEQPLEIRAFSVSEFLSESTCACDVVIFPARSLGELIDRQWVIKLPSALAPEDATDSAVSTQNAAWQNQVTYNGETWGVPLGISIPVVVVSNAQKFKQAHELEWKELLDSLPVTDFKPVPFDPAAIDRTALVDRFFAIAGGLIDRSPDYGLLFELQTMKPRLTEPEFIRAAEILVQLSSQGAENAVSGQSMVGSFSQSWSWLSAQPSFAVTLVAPSMLTADNFTESNGYAARVPPSAMGWNTGSGLIGSISANCRQSTRATSLLRWLGLAETRQALTPLILGMESGTPIAASDSAVWQATSLAREMAADERVTQELRLARAEEYRNALAASLLDILSGERSSLEALSATSEAWQAITNSRGRLVQRADYEHSLGLSRD